MSLLRHEPLKLRSDQEMLTLRSSRLVDAVTVPEDSPLRQLYNCICFSQKGHRDLPSMLAGGDLDGDLYYIMWDPDAKVQKERILEPADYPRLPPIDIGRQVSYIRS